MDLSEKNTQENKSGCFFLNTVYTVYQKRSHFLQ